MRLPWWMMPGWWKCHRQSYRSFFCSLCFFDLKINWLKNEGNKTGINFWEYRQNFHQALSTWPYIFRYLHMRNNFLIVNRRWTQTACLPDSSAVIRVHPRSVKAVFSGKIPENFWLVLIQKSCPSVKLAGQKFSGILCHREQDIPGRIESFSFHKGCQVNLF